MADPLIHGRHLQLTQSAWWSCRSMRRRRRSALNLSHSDRFGFRSRTRQHLPDQGIYGGPGLFGHAVAATLFTGSKVGRRAPLSTGAPSPLRHGVVAASVEGGTSRAPGPEVRGRACAPVLCLDAAAARVARPRCLRGGGALAWCLGGLRAVAQAHLITPGASRRGAGLSCPSPSARQGATAAGD